MNNIYRKLIVLFVFVTMGLMACSPTTIDFIPSPDFVNGETVDPEDDTNVPVDIIDATDLEVVDSVRDNSGEPQLVYVDSVDVMILESFPVQVNVLLSGQLSDGCVSVNEFAPYFDGEGWIIEVDASRPSDMICTMALVPFEEVVSLDVVDLAAGTYQVQIQEKAASFTLDIDNSLNES